jgi:hypothetical protein
MYYVVANFRGRSLVGVFTDPDVAKYLLSLLEREGIPALLGQSETVADAHPKFQQALGPLAGGWN